MTTRAMAGANLLDAIVASVRRSLEVRRREQPESALARRASGHTPRGSVFEAALARPGKFNVIAECKRRSPSRGVLRAEYDPAAIALSYEGAGAAAISVLTEPAFFDGDLEHLAAVRAAVGVPVLRKDFIVDRYQLLEAAVFGADAVLLIVAALDDRQLRELTDRARQLGLAALVEVHQRDELVRALATGATLVGVNSRDLRTLRVSRESMEHLARELPAGTVAVAESGLQGGADLVSLGRAGYRAFLVGERLMTAADPGAALATMLADAGRR